MAMEMSESLTGMGREVKQIGNHFNWLGPRLRLQFSGWNIGLDCLCIWGFFVQLWNNPKRKAGRVLYPNVEMEIYRE